MKNKNIKTKSTSVFKRLIAKKLILGGAQFGNKYGVFSEYSKMKDRKEIKKIFDFSSKKKLKYIDTAHDYRNSEDIIGKLSKKNFLIISKINIPNNFTYERIQSYVYQKIRILII